MHSDLQAAFRKVGENVKVARIRKGWKQEQLALDSGSARTTISELESGIDAKLSTLVRIAASLDVPLAVLVEDVPLPPKGRE
jgi:transcriptional regulator with XRE-family HTH domain